MDKFKNAVTKNKYIIEMENGFKNFEISYDNFNKFLEKLNDKKHKFDLNNLIIYDETFIDQTNDIKLRYDILKGINKNNIKNIKFYLSDNLMPIYMSLISNLKWKNKNTEFYMSLDRKPNDFKDLKLELSKGKICLPEEKLIWCTDKTLKLIKNNIKNKVYYDTFELKNLSFNYAYNVNKKYRLDNFTEFDKVFFTYKYIKNFIKPCKDGIKLFGKEEYFYDPNNIYTYAHEPLGSYINKNGYADGEARLMSILLNNPYMLCDTNIIYGKDKYGDDCYSGTVINDKLYYTSIYKGGVFVNPEKRGIITNDDSIYSKIYDEGYLTNSEVINICNHIKKLKR